MFKSFFPFVFLLAGCAGISVESDYDREYNFSKLSTYALAHPEANGMKDSKQTLVQKRIQKFVIRALDAKGYRRVGRDEADFLADYNYTSREVVVPPAIQPSLGFGYSPRYYGSGIGVGLGVYGGGYRREEVETLRIDIWDAKTKEHIWNGKTETNLVASNAEETEENFSKAIHAIFEKFPPGSESN